VTGAYEGTYVESDRSGRYAGRRLDAVSHGLDRIDAEFGRWIRVMVSGMSTSLLADAFGHHCWATIRLIDACLPLPAEQLETTEPGTFGSIIGTLRHLVGADRSYLFVLTGETLQRVDEDALDLAALRAVMEADGQAWAALLERDLDPDQVLVRCRDDGSESHGTIGIRLAQALHHGTDHRSQVCTALTNLGVEPPAIDAWDFALEGGYAAEIPAAS
jgi:uncharacterized damage-inducible protein DinB